jgi:integrase/recombinase XerD
MKMLLDCGSEISQSLLIWSSNFLRNKINQVSNRTVIDRAKLANVQQNLQIGADSVEMLSIYLKDARSAGMESINVYSQPILKFNIYITSLNLQYMQEIDQDLIYDFLTIATSSLADATKRNYKVALTGLFEYINKANIINETSDVGYRYELEINKWGGKSLNNSKKAPDYLSCEELTLFLNSIEEYPYTEPYSFRNRLMIKIAIYTGLRISEVLSLRVKDVTLEDELYYFKTITKGNKERIVGVKYNKLAADYNVWIKVAKRKHKDLLFVSLKNTNNTTKLSQPYVHNLVSGLLRYCGLTKTKEGAHMLRHTFATLLYRKTKDIVLVQEALDHASLNTTKIYTHLDVDRIKKVSELFDDV